MQQSSLDILADLLQRYVGEIGRSAHSYAEVCNRGAPSAEDLVGLSSVLALALDQQSLGSCRSGGRII